MRYDPQQTEEQIERCDDQLPAQPATGGTGTMTRLAFYELLDAGEVQSEAARLRARMESDGATAEARQEFDAAIGDLNAAATKTGIWR